MAIQFLIDECLHVSLPALAHERQHPASHVVHVGLGGADDDLLLARMLRESEVLCTNNARDFTGVLGREEIHPGLVVFEGTPSPRFSSASSALCSTTSRGVTTWSTG